MTQRQAKICGFGAIVGCSGLVAAALSWMMLIGFVLGIVTTVGAAARRKLGQSLTTVAGRETPSIVGSAVVAGTYDGDDYE